MNTEEQRQGPMSEAEAADEAMADDAQRLDSAAEADMHGQLMWLCYGNEDAVGMMETLGEISQVWDDIHDGGNWNSLMLNRMMHAALIELPRNPFYRQHEQALLPAMEAAIVQWEACNKIERDIGVDAWKSGKDADAASPDPVEAAAFAMRSVLTPLGILVSSLCLPQRGAARFDDGHAARSANWIRHVFHDQSLRLWRIGVLDRTARIRDGATGVPLGKGSQAEELHLGWRQGAPGNSAPQPGEQERN